MTKWSNSVSNMLRQCHRRYYFHNIAHHHPKFPIKRKAYELKQAKSLIMWRGHVVDLMLTKKIIPAISNNKALNFDTFANEAVEIAKRQYMFSKQKLYLDTKNSKLKVGDDFLVLDVHELQLPYKEQEIQEVYADIKRIILSIPTVKLPQPMGLLIDYLKSSKRLNPDPRGIAFYIGNTRIPPQIDLLLFDKDNLPCIIDWKVSKSIVSDYERQLIVCGVALYEYYKEKGYQMSFRREDIKLFEVNLYNGIVNQYFMETNKVNETKDYINEIAEDIEIIDTRIKEGESDFDIIESENICNFCNYRTLCGFLVKNNNQYDNEKYNQFVQNR